MLKKIRVEDARLGTYLQEICGIYPSGILVRFKSGRLAIVIEQTNKYLLTPIVESFFSTKSNEPFLPELIDLSKSQQSIVSAEDPEKWEFDLKQIT